MDAELKSGCGLDKGVNQGPLINKRQFDRVSTSFHRLFLLTIKEVGRKLNMKHKKAEGGTKEKREERKNESKYERDKRKTKKGKIRKR